jgi:dTDP-4-amino-4,6-dideoxygalactose transaminase
VHLFGKPISEIGEIVKYCLENKIKLIEDCAQAHGAKIHDKKV